MFKKRQKVVYPRHGAGKIVDVYKQSIGEEKKPYYKIEFLDSTVSVSIPVDSALEMGLREPASRTALLRELRNLNKRVKITRDTLTTLDFAAQERLKSGKIEDAILLVNTLRSLAKQKEKENKNFSYSASQRLEIALNFIKSEVELVLGKTAIKKYDLALRNNADK